MVCVTVTANSSGGAVPPWLPLPILRQVLHLVRAGSGGQGGVRLLADGGVSDRGGRLGRPVRVGTLRCALPASVLSVRWHGEPLPDVRHPYATRELVISA